MLRVAIAGLGFMGRTHYQCWNRVPGARVVAVCDANPNIVAETAKAVGNIGDTQFRIDFDKICLYDDFDKMLSEAELDAVSLTVPTHLHAEFAIRALSAGVNVLCEKPMALAVEDCDRMIAAAESSGKLLQIGHCVRFWPEYAKARQIVASGEYGKVVAASLRRFGAAPAWSADNWFLDPNRSGGMELDLHIHDTDYLLYLLGRPKAVSSVGARGQAGNLVHIATQYIYDGPAVTAEGGWAMTESFGFEMSFHLMLERATVIYDLTRQPVFRVCPAEGEPFSPEVTPGDGWYLQTEHFARRIAGEQLEQVTTLAESRDAVKIVAAERLSATEGRIVEIG